MERTAIVTLLILSVALAGCTGDPGRGVPDAGEPSNDDTEDNLTGGSEDPQDDEGMDTDPTDDAQEDGTDTSSEQPTPDDGSGDNQTDSDSQKEPAEPAAYSAAPGTKQAPSGNVTIHFVDVGQGDGIVLHFPDTTVVVDTGRWSGSSETAVRDHLQAEGIQSVQALVLTHPDADHTGGCDEVLAAVDATYLFHPGIDSDTQTWADCKQAIEAEGAPVYTDADLDPWHWLNLSEYATAQLLHVDASASEPNDGGIVLRVGYGDFSFLLTGDISCSIEDVILGRGYALDSDALTVAHHGSSSSTCNPWLDGTTPEVGVISVGADNSYGHPTQTVLDRLESHGVATYRTDQHGDVTLSSDGAAWSVRTEKTPTEGGSDDSDGENSSGDGTGLVITDIHADAPGNDHENENGEWVVIENQGSFSVDMTGWTLADEADHTYTFPDGFTLDAGASVTVYSGSGTDTDSELYWGSDAAIWNNSGDTAELRDEGGSLVDSYTY